MLIGETIFFYFLYCLLTGTVRRFLEKFADIERVVFAVENADEVTINALILVLVK